MLLMHIVFIMIASSFVSSAVFQPFPSFRNHNNQSASTIEHPIRIICQIFILRFVESESGSIKNQPLLSQGHIIYIICLVFTLPPSFSSAEEPLQRASFAVPDLPLAMNASGQSPHSSDGFLSPFMPCPFLLSSPLFFIFLLFCDYIITYCISFVNTFLIIL